MLGSDPSATPVGGWALADNNGENQDVQVLKSNGGYGDLLNSGESAIYWEGIAADPYDIHSGIDLSGSGLLATLTFNVSVAPADLTTLFVNEEVPLQVGMYRYKSTGRGGSLQVNRLSATLVTEPSSLGLLAIALFALAGLAAWRRRSAFALIE